MKYDFKVYQMSVGGHCFWVAKSNALKGCVGQGDTSDEAIKELELNEADWLETAAKCNIPIPPVTAVTETNYSGRVSLRFSPFVHEQAAEIAKQQGISLNQYINDAIITYNSSLMERNKLHKVTSEAVILEKKSTTLPYVEFE